MVTELLRTCGVSHTHLNVATPAEWKIKTTVNFDDQEGVASKGSLQRNLALTWIRYLESLGLSQQLSKEMYQMYTQYGL